MKPEFTEVLLPDGKGKYPPVSTGPDMNPPSVQVTPEKSSSCHGGRLLGGLLITVAILLLIVLGLGIGLITRYESKFAFYENRISGLEKELGRFFAELEVEEEHQSHFPLSTSLSRKGFLLSTPDTGSYEEDEDEDGIGIPLLDESDEGIHDEDEDDEHEAEEIVFGKVKIGNRKKRQIPTHQGPNSERVAIIDGSYGGKELKTPTPTESEGLRLYESLITTGGQGEPKAPEFAESEGSNVQPYHRASAAWIEKDDGTTSAGSGRRRLEVKSGDTGETGSIRFGENPFYVRSNSPYSQHYSGAIASRRASQGSHHGESSSAEQNPHMIVRNSRVPSTGEILPTYRRPSSTQHRSRSSYPYPPLKKIGQGDGEVIARVHQERKEVDEDEDPEEAAAGAAQGESSSFAVSRSYKGGFTRQQQIPGERGRDRPRGGHHRKGHPDSDAEELNIVQAEAWAEVPKSIAAHFVADPSNFTLSHRHYEGNGRLRNGDGIFSSWRAADWMAGSDGAKEFSLSPTGVLTVKKDGLYWVYAQIHYLDGHDINGFVVQVNTEPFLTCTRMTETVPGTNLKSNTCFTAGINYLKENDRILIRDIETNRFSIIKPEKTFFGLMRVGDMSKR